MPLLRIINGTNGSKSGHDIILSVVDAIIHPSAQQHFTWTGKTDKKNERKEKFNKLTEIHSLIFQVCREADNNYDYSSCKDDFVSKVMKYAHSRWKKMQRVKASECADNMLERTCTQSEQNSQTTSRCNEIDQRTSQNSQRATRNWHIAGASDDWNHRQFNKIIHNNNYKHVQNKNYGMEYYQYQSYYPSEFGY